MKKAKFKKPKIPANSDELSDEGKQVNADSPGDLMAEIRKGLQLKTVNQQISDSLYGGGDEPKSTAPLGKDYERAQLFDSFEQIHCFPLKSLLRGLANETAVAKSVNLNGVDQVTDVVINVLFDKSDDQADQFDSSLLLNATRLEMIGCAHITDNAVDIIASSFPNLTTVIFTGCKNLTERSLNALLANQRITSIDMSSTGVKVVNLDAKRLEQRKVNLCGCTIVSPSFINDKQNGIYAAVEQTQKVPTKYVKVVTLLEPTVEFSMNYVLGEGKEDKPHVLAHTTHTSPKNLKINFIDCQKWVSRLAVSERCVFILPFDADIDADISMGLVFNTIMHTLMQVSMPVFIILPVSKSGQPATSPSHLRQNIDLRILNTQTNLDKHIQEAKKDLIVGKDSEEVGFVEQQIYGRLMTLKNRLSFMANNKDVTYFPDTNMHVTNTQDQVIDKALKDLLEKCIYPAIEKLNDLYPYYAHIDSKLDQAITQIPRSRERAIATHTSFCSSMVGGGLLGPKKSSYFNALKIAHILGEVLLLEDEIGLPSKMVVTDITMFGTILSSIHKMAAPDKAGDDLTCVSADQPLWQKQNLKNHVRKQLGMNNNLHLDNICAAISSLKGLFWEVGDNLLIYDSVPTSTQIPLSHFYSGEKASESISIKFEYEMIDSMVFPVEVVSAVLQQVARLDNDPHMVALMWRSGIVLTVLPAEIIVMACEPDAANKSSSKLSLIVHTGIIQTEGSDLEEFLWSTVLAVDMIIKYELRCSNLYCSIKTTTTGLQKIKKASMISGILPNHTLLNDKKRKKCAQCGMSQSTVNMLWKMQQTIQPTLGLQSHIDKIKNENGVAHEYELIGPYVHANDPKQHQLCSLAPMTPGTFNSFSVTPLRTPQGISIGLMAENIKLAQDLATGYCKGEEIKDLNFHFETQNKKPNAGETVTLTMEEDANGELSVDIHCAEELLLNLTLPQGNYYPIILTQTTDPFLVDFSSSGGNRLKSGSTEWQVNMRLEALDKKNVSMICVASVTDVKDGKVLIHFDGWTTSYDYWAETNDPALHPIGYVAHMRENGSSQKLSPYGAVSGPHDWNDYLTRIDGAFPVPHYYFSREQTKGSPKFELSDAALRATSKYHSAIVLDCHLSLFSIKDTGERYHSWMKGTDLEKMITKVGKLKVEPVAIEWQVNMRLEAVDKKNPSMICVASITDVKDGKVLIHFDGWTTSYDYWAETNDPALHPIGYVAYIRKKGSQQRLSPPRGTEWNGWDNYLTHLQGAFPAPHHFFTEVQTKGSSPLMLSDNALKDAPIPTSGGDKDKRLQGTKMAKALQLVREFGSSTSPREQNMLYMLPWQMNKQLLQHPAVLQLYDWQKQGIHPLCTAGKDMIHAVDTRGIFSKIGKFIAGASSYFLSVLYVLNELATMHVPAELEHLIKGVKGIPADVVHLYLRQIFYYYMFPLLLFVKENSQESKKAAENMLSEIIKKAMTDPKINSEVELHGTGEKTEGTQCMMHKTMAQPSSDLSNFHRFSKNFNLITDLCFIDLREETLPDDFFSNLPNLAELVITTKGARKLMLRTKAKVRGLGAVLDNEPRCALKCLPPGISKCKNLQTLDLGNCSLTELPMELDNCPLIALNVSGTMLDGIPDVVYKCPNLVYLFAQNINLTTLSEEIGNLAELAVLHLGGSALTSLPESLSKLTQLQVLDISGVPWLHDYDSNTSILSRSAFDVHMDSHPITKDLSSKERDKLFTHPEQGLQSTLEFKDIQKLNASLFSMFPRLGRGDKADLELYGGVPSVVFEFSSLLSLNLAYQGLSKLPEHVKSLTKLRELNICDNPVLESLAEQLGALPIKSLSIKACPSLKTPPKEIVSRGHNAIMGYLQRLSMGSVACKRTKLMMVGLGGAGKTSMVQALTSGYYQSQGTQGERITDGIDITNWRVNRSQDEDVTFSVWDFAGQTVYYNTHQFFLSNRAVYLLLWNIRLGYEHAGLDFWLSSIACHAPKAPILLVGSHKDQVEKFSLPVEELQQRYPQIKGFHYCSSYTGEGMEELADNLVDVALAEKYMGEKIPEAWLKMEKDLITMRKTKDFVSWTDIEAIAEKSAIVEKTELNEAVGFLNNLGSLQHFENEFLRSMVVINPQWIVDVMACVVSVQGSAIKEGRLDHKDLSKIWSRYDQSLYEWLLRLTEVFDLTFPLHEEKANLVPCLLPEQAPDYEWPNVEDLAGITETKMLYKFQYLPAGLFNRAQVRLYQFCDSSVIWKKGSLLRKNDHLALLLHLRDSQVLVKVQGTRPENILFLVHEVFETLILESFHGVSYDFMLPCKDCLKVGTRDPCMFPASKIRRATELKAAFLQCDKYFHTLSISELHAMMPPDNSADFDVHLENSLRDLNEIRDDMSKDVFMFYCPEDIPQIGEEDRKIHPRRIYDDLKGHLKVWFPIDPANTDIKQVAVTMKDARSVLFCISDKFVKDQNCRSMFYYAKQTLQKTLQIVAIDAGAHWPKSDIGIHIATDVYVKMNDPSRYPTKIKELENTLENKVGDRKPKDFPKCFISYCWANSADAVAKGSKGVDGSLGWADPRHLKEKMEEANISCWLDIERLGHGGLFEDIAEGLRHAKVMIACVSDEYAKSKNCQMELRFATASLKIPIIVVIVGTGYVWEALEVGMLALGCPKINMQHESSGAYDRLLEAVRNALPPEQEDEQPSPSVTPDLGGNQQAFQELLELAQRKFQRQVASYCDKMEVGSYPRLFTLDFITKEDVETIHDMKQKTQALPRSTQEKEEDKAMVEEEDAVAYSYILEEFTKECKHNDEGICDECMAKYQEEKGKHLKEAKQILEKHIMNDTEDGGAAYRKKAEAVAEARRRLEADKSSEAAEDSTVTGISEMLEKIGSVQEGQLCVRTLCEHEQGWHNVAFGMPVSALGVGEDSFINTMAPYTARMMAILKHTMLDFPILTTQEGENFRNSLEEKCSVDPEYEDEYFKVRKLMINADKGKIMGRLARCHLPSGKIMWLCPEHQRGDRITVMSDDQAEVGGYNAEAETTIMAEEINKAKASSTSDKATDKVSKPGSELRGKLIGAQAASRGAAHFTVNKNDNKKVDKSPKAKSSKSPRAKSSKSDDNKVTAAALIAAGKKPENKKSKACVMM